MQLGHALVVAAEEGDEVLRQVVLVDLGQRADDAEVQRHVAAEGLGRDADLDVARVHVGMEEAVAEHLGEEDGHAVARQLLDVHAGLAQPVHLADRDARHALHHDHRGGAQVPVHLGHQDQRQVGHVAAQLGGVGRLAHQVQLVVQVAVELGHHVARPQPLAVGRQALDPARQRVQQRHVVVDDVQHARAQHLHGHLAAVVQRGEVDLRDRGTGHRLGLELAEHGIDRLAQALLDQAAGLGGGDWRHLVLQPRQFVGDVRRHQIAPGGQHLAKLDENRAQGLQRQPQALAARRVEAAPQRDRPGQRADPAVLEAGQHQLVDTVPQQRHDDEDQPREVPHAATFRRTPAALTIGAARWPRPGPRSAALPLRCRQSVTSPRRWPGRRPAPGPRQCPSAHC